MPTLYEIARNHKQTGPRGTVHKKSEPITKGLSPATHLPETGYVLLRPEQLAALVVPKVELNGGIHGYQRESQITHARKIAHALSRGEEIPPILVSLADGVAYCTDGQHRALGGIIARRTVPALVKQRSDAEQKRLFANQRKGRPVSPDTIVLAASGLFAEYIQESVTTDDHPWSSIVGFSRSDARIGPAQALHLLENYVGDAIGQRGRGGISDDRFDRGAANRLAAILLAFGTRADNPLAWKPVSLRAITQAAVLVLRRTGESHGDFERWGRHMPSFPFARYAHITSNRELAGELIRHWNKRLGADRRIEA